MQQINYYSITVVGMGSSKFVISSRSIYIWVLCVI